MTTVYIFLRKAALAYFFKCTRGTKKKSRKALIAGADQHIPNITMSARGMGRSEANSGDLIAKLSDFQHDLAEILAFR